MNDAARGGVSDKNHKETAASLKGLYRLTPVTAAVMSAFSPVTALAQAEDLAQSNSEVLDVVVVTATRRALDLQNVAQSIDVLSAEQIAFMGARDLQSTIRALPSISLTTLTPGLNVLTMRGISADPWEYRVDAQVAVYLDEQPMTASSQQVGVRSIDLERIENLPGPQGTLFGASSQTGTIRYITTKPDPSGFGANVEGRYGATDGGDGSYDLSGVVNIPITESFAIRAVGYTSLDGGYVDNVFGTSFVGNYDNTNLVEENFNEYEVDGGRIHALWNLSDRWSALLTVMGEDTTADGVWDSDEALGDYKVTRFEREVRYDDWVSASLTLSGDLGFADLSFNYAHFERDIVYEYDNMTYRQYSSAIYAYSLYDTDYERSIIFNDQTQERDSFELRLVSSGDSRLQWVAGAYYEDVLDGWFYGAKTYPGVLGNTTAWYYAQAYAYYYQSNPNIEYPLAPTDINYLNILDRSVTQTALFGELSYDLTDDLSVQGGVRWAEFERDYYELTQVPQGLPAFGDRFTGDGSTAEIGKDSDTVYKLGVRYNVDDERMIYGLFSQGFRVGGVNTERAANTGLIPRAYDADLVNNYEVGIKSQWLDRRLTVNATAFFMQWQDYQDSASADPWWVRGNINVGDAETLGIEAQFTWRATDNLQFGLNLFAANPEFSDNFCANFVDGVDQGCPVDANGDIDPDDLQVRAGMPLPNSPEMKAHFDVQYTIPHVLGGDLWFYYDFSYQSETWNNRVNIIENDRAGISPDWTWSSLSAGLSLPNQWDVDLQIANLFNQDGYTYVFTAEANDAEYFGDPRYRRLRAQDRPRTVWFTVSKGFGNQ